MIHFPALVDTSRIRRTRTLCADGTVMEFVELDGSNDGLGSISAEGLDRWVAGFPIRVSGNVGSG